MYNQPYYYSNNYYRTNSPKSYVRILHSSPDAPAVDIYANGVLFASNLNYKSFTPYASIESGSYNIKVFPAGKKISPIIDTTLNVPDGKIFTVAAIGNLSNISLLPIEEPRLPRDPKKVYLRFAHLSPNAPSVDITLPSGAKLFNDVQYKEVTNYIPVDPGVYNLQAKVAGTGNVVLNVPNIRLKPNRFYTVYAVGLVNSQPPLQVLIPLDGNSYL